MFLLWLAWTTARAEPHDPATAPGRGGGLAGASLGVFLGSGAWWVVLTSIVSIVRHRVTTTWIRRIDVASGFAIGGFAAISIASAVV